MESRNKLALRTALLSAITNAVMAVGKGIAGVLGHSDALLADAIESVSDVFSSILVIFGIRYAQKPADDDHPYGHGRAESLSTLATLLFDSSMSALPIIASQQGPSVGLFIHQQGT